MPRLAKRRSEPILFLLEAADVMGEYRATHGVYATAWHQLEIDFAARPFRLGEPDTHPTPESERSWRPKDCAFTYWIEPTPPDRFLIRARSEDGVAVYEIAPGMNAPRRLRASGVP